MRLVSIPKDRLKNYTKDAEMLQKADRPCALIMRLSYKGSTYSFAVPLRSNISPNTPKNQYYPLPPRRTTKSKYRHGVHYIKMFPVTRDIVCMFHTENNVYMSIVKSMLDRDEKRIIKECQEYLIRYEAGERPQFATDIDYLLTLL